MGGFSKWRDIPSAQRLGMARHLQGGWEAIFYPQILVTKRKDKERGQATFCDIDIDMRDIHA